MPIKTGSALALLAAAAVSQADIAEARVNSLSHSLFGKILRSKKRTGSQAFLSLGLDAQTKSTLDSYYHTSDQIQTRLRELQEKCSMLSIDTKRNTDGAYDAEIDIATIRSEDAGPDGGAKNKFFILFGEHARELISPESALHFIETLCGQAESEDDVLRKKAQETLKHSEFQVVVNGNPNSRRKVEEGDYCLRVNGQGVDLNRNWDEKWLPADKSDSFAPADTNPGPR